jgi:hypothetical protein
MPHDLFWVVNRKLLTPEEARRLLAEPELDAFQPLPPAQSVPAFAAPAPRESPQIRIAQAALNVPDAAPAAPAETPEDRRARQDYERADALGYWPDLPEESQHAR